MTSTRALFLVACVVLACVGCKGPRDASGADKSTGDYNVDWKFASCGSYAVFEANVSGEPARLAVILIDPSGESSVEVIDATAMSISGCQQVQLQVSKYLPGDWILRVKTLSPAKVVWEKKLSFSDGQVEVASIEPIFRACFFAGNFEGYSLDRLKVSLHRKGNIPVCISECLFSLNGGERYSHFVKEMLVSQSNIINMGLFDVNLSKKEWLQPGGKCLLEGELILSDGRKISFKQELVAPASPP